MSGIQDNNKQTCDYVRSKGADYTMDQLYEEFSNKCHSTPGKSAKTDPKKCVERLGANNGNGIGTKFMWNLREMKFISTFVKDLAAGEQSGKALNKAAQVALSLGWPNTADGGFFARNG